MFLVWNARIDQFCVCFAVIFVTNTRFLSLFVVLVGDQYGTSGGGAMSAMMGLWELRRVLPPPLWRRLFEHALT